MNTTRKSYPTDLTDQEGQLIEPRLPKRVYGTKPKHHPRAILNAIFYILATGCPHVPPRLPPLHPRFVPLPPLETARCLATDLGAVAGSRPPSPREGANPQHLDSGQPDSARRLQRGGRATPSNHGVRRRPKDRWTQAVSRGRQLGVSAGVYIAPAHLQEVYGGLEGLARACAASWRVRRVYGDGGYRGSFERLSWEVLGVEVWVVPKLTGSGFVVLPKRWIVERTLSWLSGVRRLCRDDEARVESRASWLYER